MEILFLLIPLSVVLVLLVLGVFGWALTRGQFEDLEREGERILAEGVVFLESRQEPVSNEREQSARQVPDP